MKKSNTTNTFQDGLIMDLNPMVTPNTCLTNALNATFLTYNGNENVLQNDMGNGRVETAYLPEGFIPVGTCSFGGIIYIASYNPFTNQSQLGSFPSPERNITSDEICTANKEINESNFYISEDTIGNPRYKLILLDNRELSPGDKFQIGSKEIENFKEKLSAYNSPINNINSYPRQLKLHVISIDSKGTITYLDDDLVWYKDDKYYIRNKELESTEQTDINEYRDIVTANYSVYTAKTKGKIGILAELEAITSFDVSYKATVTDETTNISTLVFDHVLPDVDSSDEEQVNLNKVASITLNVNWTYDNLNKYARNQVNPIGCKIEYDDIIENKEIVLAKYNTNSNYIENYYYSINNKSESIVAANSEELYTKLDNKNLIRRNDGSDPDYSLTPITKSYVAKSMLTDNNDPKENILTLSVTPAMNFGYLGYLTKEITINLDKLGTGEIDLKGYKYYVNQEDVILNWSLDAYPEEGKEIKQVSFNFYKLNQYVVNLINSNPIYKNHWDYFDSYKITETNLFEGKEETLPHYSYPINNKSSYSGTFSNNIKFNPLFEKNTCYVVQIEINYGSENNIISYYYYRILYTVPIFNKYYFNIDYPDFCECTLDRDLFYYDLYYDDQYIAKSKINYRYENKDKEIKRFSLNNTFIRKAKEDEEQEQYNNTRQENYIRVTADRSYILKPINYSGFELDNLFSRFKFKPSSDSEPFYGIISEGSNSNQMSINITSILLDKVNVVSPIKDPTSEISNNKIMLLEIDPGRLGSIEDNKEDEFGRPKNPNIVGSGGGSGNNDGNNSGTSSGSIFEDKEDEEEENIDYKPCILQLAVGKMGDDSFNTSDELISLYIQEADLLINSPFIVSYLLDNITVSYSLEQLVQELTPKQLVITPKEKSDIYLRYSGIEIAHVTDKQYINVDLQGSPVLRTNFVDSAFSSSDFGTFEIYHSYSNTDQPEYIVRTDSGNAITNKTGDIGVNVKNKNEVMISGTLIKGIDSQLFIYRNIQSIQDELNNRYKWVESNDNIELYKINNLIWWSNYSISIPFKFSKTIQPQINSFNINNAATIIMGSGIPKNFQIESIPELENLELVIKYSVNTDNLKQLLNTSDIYFFNKHASPEKQISQNESINTILIKSNDKFIQAPDLKIGSKAKYRLSCKNNQLKIQQIDEPGASGIGSFYYMTEADHMKNKEWYNGVTNNGQILRLSNLLIG